MLKVHRLILKAVKALNVEITEVSFNRGGHIKLTVVLPSGARHKLTGAGSPHSQDGAVREVTDSIRRLLRAESFQPRKQPKTSQ